MPNLDELRRAHDAVLAEAAELQRAEIKGPAWESAYARVTEKHWRIRSAFIELLDAR